MFEHSPSWWLDKIHDVLVHQLAELRKLENRPQIIVRDCIFIGGGKAMDFTRVNAAAAKNKSVGDVLDSIFDALAAAIRDAGGDQAKLDELATQLESDNVREELRVNALKGLVTPAPPSLTAAWNGPSAGTVNQSFSGSVAAAGGTAPYSFSQDAGGNEGGALPDGLTFNADGTVSGVLTRAGEFNFGGSVTDSGNATARWSATVTVTEAQQ